MKKYIKYFRVPYIIIAILIVVFAAAAGIKSLQKGNERSNSEQTDSQRVFDYADVLTDEEEEKLEKLIAMRQKQVECDILLVTINQSLEEYGQSYGYYWTEDYVMCYADNFYDNGPIDGNTLQPVAGKEGSYGYNKPHGDGVIYVDNWYREADGYCYTYFSTSGKCEDRYSSTMIEELTDVATDDVNEYTYEAYKNYVNQVCRDVDGGLYGLQIPGIIIFGIAAFITVIFFAVYGSNRKGKKTTHATTYVNGGKPVMNNEQDILYDKRVVSRKIESSSGGSGGGGGHHVSSGGHSHGGGGGRH